jgi:SAM-dependent methyltransferase
VAVDSRTDPREWPEGAFERIDHADDAEFYAPPRLVTHIDDNAIAALGAFYAKVLPRDAVLLDLMSSWVSHLPDDFPAAEVIGHGMNEAELAANPRLVRWFVADLNQTPLLPLEDASVDAAMCCVSVQYLTRPIEVFAEVRRVLRPGGTFVVSFSNRCFPTKAVAVWRSLDDRSHASLVHLYFERAGFGVIAAHVLANGFHGDPLYAVIGKA